MAEKRFLGITIQPMYFQSEGVDAVLDSLSDAGVTALATAPSVYEEIDEARKMHKCFVLRPTRGPDRRRRGRCSSGKACWK